MQLLGSAKFLTDDENPKEKVKFLKVGELPEGGGGGEFPRNFAPRKGDILLGISPPLGGGAKFLGQQYSKDVFEKSF